MLTGVEFLVDTPRVVVGWLRGVGQCGDELCDDRCARCVLAWDDRLDDGGFGLFLLQGQGQRLLVWRYGIQRDEVSITQS